MSSPKTQQHHGIQCFIHTSVKFDTPRLITGDTWHISVPLQWLAKQPGAAGFIFHKEYDTFKEYADDFTLHGIGRNSRGTAMKMIRECRDRIECLTEAFPDHPNFPALLASAIELEAKATLLNAATGGR